MWVPSPLYRMLSVPHPHFLLKLVAVVNVFNLVLTVACQSNEWCTLYFKLLINVLIKRSLGVLLFEKRRRIAGYFDL